MNVRTNLMMQFHCSECGNQLCLSYDSDDGGTKIRNDINSWSEEPKPPTGAKIYGNPRIKIDPCKPCIEKYTLPAKKLTEALKQINKLDDGKINEL